MFKIEIPEKAKQIINQLEQAGYEAYVVGLPSKGDFFIYDRHGNRPRYGDSDDGKRTV